MPRLARAAVEKVAAETAAVAKIEALKPSRSDVESMRGARIAENGDGTWTASVPGVGAKELAEAHRPWARAAEDRSQQVSALRPVEWLKRSDGTLVPADPSNAKAIADRQGLKAHESRRPTHIHRDGRWWRRSGNDWIPEAS